MDKLKDAIFGFAIGDALGVPYEFKARDTFKCEKMIGNGTWNQPMGTWSDDTSMVLATMDSLSSGYLDKSDLMNKFLSWYKYGNYTPYGVCFDIGRATKFALTTFEACGDTSLCGGTSEQDNGNGALMRILPFAFLNCDADLIDGVSALTHNTSKSKFACEMYVELCKTLIKGTFDPFNPYICMIRQMSRDQVRSTGYVLDSLVAAIWCFSITDNYKDCVLTAVNLGNDTDTIAALAGALAGLHYGYDAIPKEWIDNLAAKDEIETICKKFAQIYIAKSR